MTPFNPDIPNLQPDGEVYLLGRRRRIERVRWDRERILLRLEGLESRSDVDDTRGALLEVAEGDLVRDPDAHLVYEIIGLEVVMEEGRSLGKVSEVLSTGANDVYVVKGPAGETLIPAIASVVQAIDVAGGMLHIYKSARLG